MISKEEVIREQERWGNGLVFIGAAATWEESRNRAEALIQDLYVLDGSQRSHYLPPSPLSSRFCLRFSS